MFEPTGPLPTSVYWRRRALAGGVCVIAVALLVWIIGGLVGPADDQPVRGTAGSRELVMSPSSPPPSARPAGPSPSTRASTTSSGVPPSSTAATPSGTPTTRPAPIPAGPPKRCRDAVIRVVAQPGAPSYRLGARPLLRLLVVNVGKVPCTRDVSRKLRELVITTADGRNRLWSSNDCYAPDGFDKRTLAPGKPLRFSLNWAGRTSEPACPVQRLQVQPGKYRLYGKLGKLTGPPATLTLTP